ncbi:MAG: TolC family protein [Spirochaetia bacterium]
MNKKFYGSLFLILIFLSAPTVFAQSVDGGAAGATDTIAAGEEGAPLVLGPAEAFERAYRHDLSRWQQSRDVDLAEQKRRWRYLQLLPQLEAEAVLLSFEQVPSQWQSDLSAVLSLTFNAASLAELKTAELGYHAAAAGLAAYRSEYRADVYRDYYNLLLLQEEQALQKKQLESARARLEAAHYDFESGRISEYELLSAQLSVQEQAPQLESTQIKYRSAVRRFKQELGLPEVQVLELNASLQDIPFKVGPAKEIIAGLPDSPGIEAQVVEVARQRLNSRMVHTRFLPQLRLSLTRGAVNSFQGEGFSEYDSSRYAFSLSFTFNDLLPGSEYRNARHSAETQLESAVRSLDQSLQDRRTMVEETAAKLQKVRRDIEAAELRLELAERFYEIAQTEYENGRRDLLEVEEAELQRGEARLNLLRAYYSRIDLLITLARYSSEGATRLR